MSKRQHFSREFKLEAVRLLTEGKKPSSDIARELGTKRNQLYKRKDELETHGEAAFPGTGRRSSPKVRPPHSLRGN